MNLARKAWFAGAAVAPTMLLGFYLATRLMPLPEGLEASPTAGATFLDRKGIPVRQLPGENGLRVGDAVRLDEISGHLVEATLAAEDHRFYRHRGIDLVGLGRAVTGLIRERRIVSGASTITQQLIKLSSPPSRRTPWVKAREMILAVKLERRSTKDKILEGYLNRLPYGNQLTGIHAASWGYLGKPPSDLSRAEAAFLAGLPNRPTRFNPHRNLAGAQNRQAWILGRMHSLGLIGKEEMQAASIEEIRLEKTIQFPFHAPHFIGLHEKLHGPTEEGQRVVTTIDLELNERIQRIVESRLESLADSRWNGDHPDVQVAVVVIENAGGEVRGLIGSRSFFGSTSGQINGAWVPRSAGSTLKPFTYLMALENGFTAGSILADVPVEYVSAAGAYQPVNFDRRCRGPVTLREALATSLNIPAVRLLREVGGPVALASLLRDDLGMTTLKGNGGDYGLGLTIGNAEVRLIELANAYACLARLGQWKPYRLGARSNEEPANRVESRFDSTAAWILADILSDHSARAGAFGFESALKLPFRAAVKTGTSTDFRDNWTVGFTPAYTVGVWMGRFDNGAIPNRTTGATGAAPIFREVLIHLHEQREPTWYPRPDDIVAARIDGLNGKRINPDLAHLNQGRPEFFKAGTEPPVAAIEDYDPSGKTILDGRFREWWETRDRSLDSRACIANKMESTAPLVITSPKSGTVAYLDPDLPKGGRQFPLQVDGRDESAIKWSSQTLEIRSEGGRTWLMLQPGNHLIRAEDVRSGQSVETQLTVERL